MKIRSCFAFRELLLLATTAGTSLLLLGTTTAQTTTPGPLNVNAPFNEAPIVFSHNAATGYVVVENPALDPITPYSLNQDVTLTEQLACGARGFDLRPKQVDDDVVFHHGDLIITEITFLQAIREILEWSSSEGGVNELIVLKIGECEDEDSGGSCDNAVESILSDEGVDFVDDCGDLSSFAVGDALEQGPVLAIKGSCFQDNYVDTITCHGFSEDNDPANVQAVRDCIPELQEGFGVPEFIEIFTCLEGTLTPDLVNVFDCWADSDTKSTPIENLDEYLQDVVDAGPPQDGSPWQLQAHWQQNQDVFVLGIFRPLPLPTSVFSLQPSSIIQDLDESEVNRLVLDFVKDAVDNGDVLNMVEVDGVCDQYASQLLLALRPEQEGPDGEPSPSPSMMPSGGEAGAFPAPSAMPSGLFAEPSAMPSGPLDLVEPTPAPLPPPTPLPTFAQDTSGGYYRARTNMAMTLGLGAAGVAILM